MELLLAHFVSSILLALIGACLQQPIVSFLSLPSFCISVLQHLTHVLTGASFHNSGITLNN